MSASIHNIYFKNEAIPVERKQVKATKYTLKPLTQTGKLLVWF